MYKVRAEGPKQPARPRVLIARPASR